ncbi:unnamed protein product [Haemonchus placei]|uniref:Uncharacterized protein n=1 Tax=Haemonchus placei TaxID=6290 RepID=A0A3P7VXQ6_HAEPC|nr:unnamed protein product [Haemonchus placei]
MIWHQQVLSTAFVDVHAGIRPLFYSSITTQMCDAVEWSEITASDASQIVGRTVGLA